MLTRILLFFLFFVLFFTLTQGQVNNDQRVEFNELPVQFLQVVKNYPLLNPSYAAVDSNVNLVSGNKMNFGAFHIFKTNYFSATFRIPSSRDSVSKNHHGIGLSAVTDKNGEFIRQNRIYVTYAYKISLSDNLNLSSGLSMGIVNRAIEGTSINPGGSATTPDGNVGIWIFRRKSYLGLSYNQIFNSKLTPLKETSVLLKHINVIAGKSFTLGSYLQLNSSLVVRAAKKSTTDIDLVNLLLIRDKLSAGFNYKHHKGLVWMIGLENIFFRNGRHMAGGWFSYSIPFGKYVSNSIQPYEITLTYKIL